MELDLYYGLKPQDISASAVLILAILLSFFAKISLPNPPTLWERNSKSTQHSIYKLNRPYLVLCNRATAAVRWLAFGIACKNLCECLWIRFTLSIFSPHTHTHKGNTVSVSSPSALSCASCSVTSLLRFHTPPRKPPLALTMPSLYPSAPNTHLHMHKSPHVHTQAGKHLHVPVLTHTHTL